MGNCLRGERRNIKIMKVDGTVMNLRSPAYVKEVVCDYPNLGLFEAASVRRLGGLSRPLPHSAELRAGDLYFLIPLATSSASADAGLHSPQSVDLTKEEMGNKLKLSRGSLRIVSICVNGSTMRLTIRLSKKDAASLLGIDEQELMKKIGASFCLSTMEKKQQKVSEWKPSLETIAEDLRPALLRSTSTEI